MRLRALLPVLAAAAMSCGDPTAPNPREVHAVVAGVGFSCALVGESVYCWGRNDLGQLGRGTTGPDAGPGLVTGDRHFRLLGASERTVCGVTTDNGVYCWGHGRIFGLADPVTSPTQIQGTFPSSITSIGVGYSHGCVLGSGGAATCFGTNGFGELGAGNTQPATGALGATPVTGGHSFSQLSVGGFHTCGIKAQAPWCWGGNFNAAFGPGTDNQSTFPTPTLIGLSFPVVRVDVGSAVTCVLDTSSKAWCWGTNIAGQLGRGVGTASPSSAIPTAVSQISNYSALAFPNINSIIAHTCGVQPSGSAICWGLGDASQLGRAATETCQGAGTQTYPCSAAPGAVETTFSFKQLSLGRDHTCGLTTNGEIYCWGTDVRRQLGGSVGGPSATPVRVTIPE